MRASEEVKAENKDNIQTIKSHNISKDEWEELISQEPQYINEKEILIESLALTSATAVAANIHCLCTPIPKSLVGGVITEDEAL